LDYFKIAYTAAGGLGIFFLGMKFLSEGLQSIAGDFIKKLISGATSNRIVAVLVGLTVTTIVQSSSITTVMVVGMVNAGLMGLSQAIGVVLGANIGTTITGWILAIKVGNYGLLLIGIGIFPLLFSRNERFSAIGKAVLALGLVFFGLELMSGAFKPLRTDPNFISLLHYLDARSFFSVLGCVAIGCVLTFLIQSSSAMLGITIALAVTGTITFHTAAALVLGENLGTTITAQLAAIGGTTTAKRAAASHAIFNLLGVAIVVVLFQPFVTMVDSLLPGNPDLLAANGSKPYIAAHIALGHSLFNVTAVLIMLPFTQYLARLVEALIPERGQTAKYRLQYINTPGTMSTAVGLQMVTLELQNMTRIVHKTLRRTKQYIQTVDNRFLESVEHLEEVTDHLQKEITTFVCSIMEGTMSSADSRRAYATIRAADELESISDYCLSLCRYRTRLKQNKQDFSPAGWEDINEYTNAVMEMCQHTFLPLLHSDSSWDFNAALACTNSLNEHADRVKERHLKRLSDGTCEPLPALTFSDMIVALRRIKNHTLNLVEALSFEKERHSSSSTSTQSVSSRAS